jgi:hypothetical protein
MKTMYQYRYCPLYLLKKKNKVKSIISIVLMFAFLNLTMSCSYYNVKQVPNTKETIVQNVNQFNDVYRYVIIHRSGTSWHLNNVKLNEENQSISGTVQLLNPLHEESKLRDTKVTHRYNSNSDSPLNEVHFYLDDKIELDVGKRITIPFENIISISVNEKNKAKGTSMTILAVVGCTVGLIGLIAALVALLKSSCPFVYVDTGNGFAFVGELYPGVIFSNMQRDDYIPLPGIKVSDNECRLKITNELLEIQYTDLAQLIVVDHPEDIEVLLDKNGNLHSFSSIQTPLNVIMDDCTSNIEPGISKDNYCYTFNTDMGNQNSTRDIVFEFDKPEDATIGKLYLTAKNSLWLDYVYGKFNEQFGNYYSKFQKDQEKTSKEQKLKWLNEQHIPLSIYMNTGKEWELIDKINTVGPLAMRNIVVSVNLKNDFDDKIQIKLETGFMFWEVDYIGMDYSNNTDLKITYIEPTLALDENNKEVTSLLMRTDQQYLVQPNVGDNVTITYRSEGLDDKLHQSFFLKNRGYYTYIRDYKGIPDFDYLKTFKESSSFTRFSEEVYHIVLDAYSNEDLSMSHE